MFTTFDIPLPRLRWKWSINAEDVFIVGFVLLCIAALAVLLIGAGIHLAHPPKVVTKTVTSYATPQTQAMQTFIKDCENSSRRVEVDGSTYKYMGVPNTSTKPWSCNYAG